MRFVFDEVFLICRCQKHMFVFDINEMCLKAMEKVYIRHFSETPSCIV